MVEPHPVETMRRIVVVSPHLDDGVLSLGASIASWSRAGAAVDLLTVLACDPDSERARGGWDRRGGFATEGESARGRREEDRRACAVLGARPVWLPFGSVDYERHGTDEDVRRPSRPPSTARAWCSSRASRSAIRTTNGSRASSRPCWTDDAPRLYAEQPYTRRTGVDPEVPPWVSENFGARTFAPVAAGPRDRAAKWRAIRCYRSQLPLLGMHRSLRRGPLPSAFAPEWVAWGAD